MANRSVDFTLNLRAQSDQALNSINKIKTALDNIYNNTDGKLSDKTYDGLVKGLDKASNKIIELQAKSKNGLKNMSDVNKVSKGYDDLAKTIDQIIIKFKNTKVKSDDFLPNSEEFKQLSASLRKIKNDLTKVGQGIKSLKNIGGAKDFTANIKNTLQSEGSAEEKKAAVKQQLSDARKQEKQNTRAERGKVKELAKQYGTMGPNNTVDTQALRAKINEDKMAGVRGSATNLKTLDKVTGSDAKIKAMENQAAAAQKLITLNEKLAKSEANIAAQMEALSQPAAEEGKQTLEGMGEAADSFHEATKSAKNDVESLGNTIQRNDDVMKRSAGLKQFIGNFFSLSMVFSTVRRAVNGAIKDFMALDKQFNEISIVTGKTMQDMWSMYTRLNKTASDYGVVTSDVVSVQKLYYQQGRSTIEVNQLTGETLKFAKISGLEYADATDKMTAALNAYNLKASEAAQITDTLAALSSNAAATSEEIAIGLSKVASLAALSGTSLQETSAYVTKIVETTRESPETAGTALKTVIARFTEVKNLTEDEQELLDEGYNFNNIEKALKTVGISAKDSAGQMRGFSDILNDLGPIWDSLSTNQQHYIATQAAGSRQQSRFIALMSDWKRTAELTNVAENSEGTGNAQFYRSLNSIETAINKLKSSWQAFTESLFNSDGFKTIINMLTDLVTWLTKVSEKMGAFGPIVLALGATIVGSFVKNIGQQLISGVDGLTLALLHPFQTIKEHAAKNGYEAGVGWKEGFEQGAQSTSGRITTGLQSKMDTYKSNVNARANMSKDYRQKMSAATTKEEKAAIKKEYKQNVDKFNLKNKANKNQGNVENALSDKQLVKNQKLLKQQKLLDVSDKQRKKSLEGMSSALKRGNKLSEESITSLAGVVKANAAANGVSLQGLTTEELKQQLQEKNLDLSDEQLAQLMAQIAEQNGLAVSNGMLVVGEEAKDKSRKKAMPSIFAQIVAMWDLVKANIAELFSTPWTWALAAVAIAAIAGITIWIATMTDQTNAQAAANAEAAATAAKGNETYKEQAKAYKDLVSKYKRYKELTDKGVLSTDEEQELADIVSDLADEYSELISYYDAEGNAILKNTSELDKLIEKKKEALEVTRQQANADAIVAASQGAYTTGSAKTAIDAAASLMEGFGNAEEYTAKYELIDAWSDNTDATKDEIKTALDQISTTKIFNQDTLKNLLGTNVTDKEWSNLTKAIEQATANGKKLDMDTLGKLIIGNVSAVAQEEIDSLAQINEYFANSIVDIMSGIPDSLKELNVQKCLINADVVATEYNTDISSGLKETLADEIASAMNIILNSASNISGKSAADIQAAILKSDNYEQFKKDNGNILTESAYNYVKTGGQDSLTNFMKSYATLGKSAQGTLTTASNRVKELNGADLNKYLDGITDDELSRLFGYEVKAESLPNDVKEKIKKQVETETKALQKSREVTAKKFAKAGIDINLDDYTASQAQKIADNFSYVYDKYGADTAQNFVDSFTTVIDAINDKDLQSQLYSVDFSSMDSIDEFRQKLYLLESQGKITTDAIEQFEKAVKASGKTIDKTATSAITKLTQLESKISTAAGNLESALSGSLDISTTNDMIKELQKYGMNMKDISKYLYATADGYGLTTEGVQQYTKALIENSIATSKAQIKANQDKIKELKMELASYQAKLDLAKKEGNKDEIQALQKKYDELFASYNEVDGALAEAQRSLVEAQLQQLQYRQKLTLQPLLDELNKLIDLVSKLNGLDPFGNLTHRLEMLELNMTDYDLTLEISTNADELYNATEQKIEDLQEKYNNYLSTALGQEQVIETYKNILNNSYASQFITYDDDNSPILNMDKIAAEMTRINSLTNTTAKEQETNRLNYLIQNADSLKAAVKARKTALNNAKGAMKATEEFYKTQVENIKTLEQELLTTFQNVDAKVVESLKERYDKMKQFNTDYLNDVQKTIDKEKQIRDMNDSTEELLTQEKKLQVLIASGGSKTEIANAQKALAKQRQSYSDKVVSQLIKDLQDENTAKAESYDLEIKMMEEANKAKLDNMVEYNYKVQELMSQSQQEILDYMQSNSDEFNKATETSRQQWTENHNKMIATAKASIKAITSDSEDNSLPKIKEEYNNIAASTNLSEEALIEYSKTVTEKTGSISNSLDTINLKYSTMTGYLSTMNSTYGQIYDKLAKIVPLAKDYTSYVDPNIDVNIDVNYAYNKSDAIKSSTVDGKTYYKLSNGQWYDSSSFSDSGYLLNSANSLTGGKIHTGEGKNSIYRYKTGFTWDKNANEYVYDLNKTQSTQSTKKQYTLGEVFKWFYKNKSINNDTVLDIYNDTNDFVYASDAANNIRLIGWSHNTNTNLDELRLKMGTEEWNVSGLEFINILSKIGGGLSKIKDADFTANWANIKSHLKAYASGGLVDFTGPAWVDGTISKPEAFLSARDTILISNLTDSLRYSPSIPSLNGGASTATNYYNIDIKVDELGDGYTVDNLAEEIENRILQITNGNITQIR